MNRLLGVAPLWVWAVAGLLLLALLILLGLFLLLRRSQVHPLEVEGEGGTARALAGDVHASRLQWLHLRMSFLRAMRSLREHVAGRSYRYGVPWLLLMGEEGSGKTTLLDNTGMSRSWYASDPRIEGHGELGWGFFDRGILLDAPGAFVLHKDGISSDEHGWNGLLKLLQRHRARRPLDGIVLTLPCRDLLDDSLSAAASTQHKATILFEKLWEAERVLGMRLPVYVLVTQCDLIPGFQSFAQSLPEEWQEGAFGWSNPYHLETAFSAAWVDEAFITMQEELQRVQSELFVGPRQIADPDRLFLFPGAFWRLREPLRTCLSRIFKETGYRESFFFRGVYFCGDLAGATAEAGRDGALALWMPEPGLATLEAEADAVTRLTPQPTPVFLRQLFENRIFPEFGVARPNSRAFLSHNRLTLGSQVVAIATAVILTIGTAFSYHRLQDEDQRVVLPFLREIATDRDRVQKAAAEPMKAMESGALSHNEYDMLTGMAELGNTDFRSWFLPASHFSRIHREINLAMVPAFEQLVFKTIRVRLERKAARLIGSPVASPAATAAEGSGAAGADATFTVEQTKEYQNLKQYGDQLRQLQNAIDTYETMRKPGVWISPAQFQNLVVYLGGHPLPEDFDYEDNPQFRAALAQSSGEDYTCAPNLRQQATQRTHDLVEQLYGGWYGHNVLLDDADVIEQQTAAVMDHSSNAQEDPDLTTLQAAISQLQGDLANPGLAEIVQGQFQLTNSGALKSALQPSCYVSGDVATFANEEGQAAFNRLQQALLQQSTSLTGPVFDAGGGALQLSQGMLQLQAGIAHMQKLPFMSSPTDTNLAALPPGMQLIWNIADLQQALGLQQAYDSFTQTDLAGTPWRLHDALRRLALRQLQHTMLHMVGQAQQFTPISGNAREVSLQQDLIPGIQSFQSAQPSLEKLQSLMRRWGQYGALAKLRSITGSQALQLLELLDEKFNEQAPYVIRDGDFSWWNGQQPASLGAFGVAGADGMAEYLAFQQSRIQSYADLAQPLVTALNGADADLDPRHARLLTRWSSIVRASSQAASQNPNSTLAQLNQFIRTGMDQITPARDCVAPAGGGHGRADYFLQVRNRLQQQLRARCLDVELGSAWSSYTQLEGYFNEHLAGRFPFVAASQVDSTPGADPAAVRQFLQMLGQTAGSARVALARTRQFGSSRVAALQFLQQAEGLETFFGAFAKAGAQTPALDVTPTFRVNRDHERGGDRIIGWSFQSGGQTAQQGTPASLRWVYGQPVAVHLRWAMNSPIVPTPSTAGAHVGVSGHLVSFNYNDAWSLLRLLRHYQAPATDFTGLTDAAPVTLALPAETISTTGAASPPTLVFVRLQVSPAGQKTPLALPEFPTHAPQLVRPQGEE